MRFEPSRGSQTKNKLGGSYVTAKCVKKKIREKIIIPCGKTTDDKIVVKGIGKFYDCIGYPLDMILVGLKKEKLVIDWIDFVEYGIEKQWNIKQMLSKIEESIEDKTEKEYVLIMLKNYLIKKFKT